MKTKLTKRAADALRPAAKLYSVWDTDLAGFLLRVAPSGKMTWFLSYRNAEGRRLSYKIGNYPGTSPDGARALAMTAAGAVAAKRDPQAEKLDARMEADRRQASTLGKFLTDRYEPWATTQFKSGGIQVARIKADFVAWLDKPMDAIHPFLVEGWRKECRQTGTNPRTINRNLQRLRAAVQRAVEWKILPEHPFAAVRPLKTDKGGIVRYLSEVEEAALRTALVGRETKLRKARESFNAWRKARHQNVLPIRAAEYVDHIRPLALVALNTGLRRGELFNLTWRDVDLAGRMVTVQGGGAKSGHTRRVPLNAEASDVLGAWKRQAEDAGATAHVFPSAEGKRLDNVNKGWRSVCKLAGLTDFRFHDCRHHFASRLVQAGTDLNVVRELLGHADLTMTLRYAHLAPGNMAAAVERVAR